MTAPFAAAPRSPRAASATSPDSSGGVPVSSAARAIRVVFPISLGVLLSHAINPAASRSRSSPSSVNDAARISACWVSSVTSPGASWSQPPPMNSVTPAGNSAAISSRPRNSSGPPRASPQANPSNVPAYRSSRDTREVVRVPRLSDGGPESHSGARIVTNGRALGVRVSFTMSSIIATLIAGGPPRRFPPRSRGGCRACV